MFESVNALVAVLAVVVVVGLWVAVPVALFGVKRRLDAILAGRQAQTEALVSELRRANELLYASPDAPAREGAGSAWRSPSYTAAAE